MNRAVRGGVILLICLLAVFPCGAALTVVGALVGEVFRSYAGGGRLSEHLNLLWMPVLWAGGGVLGFLFLISGVDKLIAAQHRLRWYVLFAICLEIAAAGFFSATYPLRGPSAIVFRLVSIAPVAIALAILIHHLFRFFSNAPRTDPVLPSTDTAMAAPDTREPRQP